MKLFLRNSGCSSVRFPRTTRALAIVGMISTLSACAEVAVQQPPSSYGITDVAASSLSTDIGTYARKKARFFDDEANSIQEHDVAFDAGILITAMTAAASLFYFQKQARANVLEGLGVGAGGLTVWKGRLDPKAAASAYRTAATQLRCVDGVITSLPAKEKAEPLRSTLAHLTELDQTAATAVGASGVSEATRAAFDTDNKIVGSAMQLLQKIVDAITNGNAYAISEIDTIESNLSQALNKQTISYAAALNQIQQAASEKAQNADNATAAKQPSARLPASPPPGSREEVVKADKVDKTARDAIDRLMSTQSTTQNLILSNPYQDTRASIQACISNSSS